MRPCNSTSNKSFHFESSCHSISLLNGLNALRSKEQLFDVTLVAESQRFGAHRAVLAACSDYFRLAYLWIRFGGMYCGLFRSDYSPQERSSVLEKQNCTDVAAITLQGNVY